MALRLCIRARWTCAVVALLLLSVSIFNYWRAIQATIPVRGSHLGVTVRSACMSLGASSPPLLGVPWFELAPQSMMDIRGHRVHYWHWQWTPSMFFNPDAAPNYCWLAVNIPLWIPLAFAIGVATAGFWHGRKRPPGTCRACGHTLAGASVCFECGTAAPEPRERKTSRRAPASSLPSNAAA